MVGAEFGLGIELGLGFVPKHNPKLGILGTTDADQASLCHWATSTRQFPRPDPPFKQLKKTIERALSVIEVRYYG